MAVVLGDAALVADAGGGSDGGVVAEAVVGSACGLGAVRPSAPPTWAPPAEQSPRLAVTVAGWHRKKLTVPVGAGPPAMPVAVAESVTLTPGTWLPPVGLEVVAVDDGCLTVVKHSVV